MKEAYACSLLLFPAFVPSLEMPLRMGGGGQVRMFTRWHRARSVFFEMLLFESFFTSFNSMEIRDDIDMQTTMDKRDNGCD